MACLKTYLADAEIRGKMPFQRVREEELSYVLDKLASLHLDPATMSSAYPTTEKESNPLRQALMANDSAHIFKMLPLLTSLLAHNTLLSKSGVPYRLTSASQAIVGLPEGVELGKVGAPVTGEPKLMAATELARRCLDRAAQVVAL